jgi:single-strand DNA-binding protein
MALGLNKVVLIGNLGRDPEIRSTSDGREIASFTLATTESWKDKSSGERKEATEWHKIAVFNEGLVEIVKKHVKKGTKLYLEGSLRTRKWTDNAGIEKYTTEVVISYTSTFILLDSKNTPNAGTGGSAENPSDYIDDDLPF